MVDRFIPGKIPESVQRTTSQVSNPSDRPQVRVQEERVFGDNFTYERVQPLTEAQIVPVAGGRTIGGGTSREALRRAQRKSTRGKI